MNTQPPCPDPPLPPFPGLAPPENSLTLPGTPPPTTPPNLPLPRPWLLMREAEAWRPQNLFRDSSGTRHLVMEGFIHTTELGAPAANGAETSPASAQDPPPSPGPPLPPPSRTLSQREFISHSTELGAPAAKGAETSPRRAQDPPQQGVPQFTLQTKFHDPMRIHSPHLPLPRPWLLIREADAGALRIYFAILNFKRLAGIEPGSLS